MKNINNVNKCCKDCEYLQNPMGGHCYMFYEKPKTCNLNNTTVTSRKSNKPEFQFICIGGRRYGKNTLNRLRQKAYLRKQTNVFIQTNYAELETKVMADAIKSGGKIPDRKIDLESMYGRNESSQPEKPTSDKQNSKRQTVKIERTTGGGCGFNSVDCPECKELIILDGIDMRTMYTICKKCGCIFNLENSPLTEVFYDEQNLEK